MAYLIVSQSLPICPAKVIPGEQSQSKQLRMGTLPRAKSSIVHLAKKDQRQMAQPGTMYNF